MNNFRTGQKVGCIYGADIWFETDDGSRRLRPLPNPPIKGHIYTIKTMKSLQKANLIALEFEEMAGWWDARAFRPVVQHKTDISIFNDILVDGSGAGIIKLLMDDRAAHEVQGRAT